MKQYENLPEKKSKALEKKNARKKRRSKNARNK